MSRTCGKRLMIAMACASTLIWLASGIAAAQTSQKAAFARVVVSGWNVVYIQIQDGEMRTAMTVHGLQSAEPVQTTPHRLNESADLEYALPIPADQLPAGVTAIKASLTRATALIRSKTGTTPLSLIIGQIAVCRTDAQKSEWQYVSQVDVQAGADADRAPSIKLPNLDRVKATIETKPSSGRLAAGLRIVAGEALLSDIRKDGQSVEANLTVMDAWGTPKVSKAGPLSAFGFS
jgi:hypothetical protein